MTRVSVPNRHGLPGERTGTADEQRGLAASGHVGENLSEEVAAGSTPVTDTCDNCGDGRGVRLVTCDTMVGYLESAELCRVCRGETEEIRDERSDDDVYAGTE